MFIGRMPRLLVGIGVLLVLVGASGGTSPGQAQDEPRCFTEVPHCISGRLRHFWEQAGGLAVFGFPMTPQHEAWIEGRPYQVQWFQRNRLELHPEHAPPYDVLLGRLGDDRLNQQQRPWHTAFPRSEPQEGCFYVAETGHNICGRFLAAWQANGLEMDGQDGTSVAESLALYGLPLSEAHPEILSDGRSYTVQWFERARFEHHPEHAPPYDVLFGLLADELQQENGPLTADSPLFSPPRATAEQVAAYIVHRGTTYTPYDVQVIVGHYWRMAPAVGIDPLLAMAQVIHETDNLKSWWSQRPRRNPAGLGVTGAEQPAPPPPEEQVEWAWDGTAQVWKKGLSFASWEDGARAHLGRLLAYGLRPGEASAAQQPLIDEALALRPLPDDLRGVARTLRGLNGRWAYPGATYGENIALLANKIREDR